MSDVRDWARLYQTPLWLTAGFIALLVIFALTPDPTRDAADVGVNPTSEPTPGPHECVVCSIDKTCDPKSGRCMFLDATPLPCVEGAKYDEKAGFCLPTGQPTIPPELLQTPDEFGQLPGSPRPTDDTATPEPTNDRGRFETQPPQTEPPVTTPT